VAFLRGSVSPWNPKSIRASAGSLFRLPVAAGVPAEALSALGAPLYALMPAAGESPEDAPLAEGGVVVVGGEGQGVSPAVRAAARPLRIPTQGVESLNAAVAGAIVLYEAARQRGRVR
jgi:TrmH family RNA methyltransferase